MPEKKFLHLLAVVGIFCTNMHAHLALTVKQVARGMGVGERRVRAWIDAGELPAFSVGPNKGTRISVRAVEKFMAERNFNQPAYRCQQTAK